MRLIDADALREMVPATSGDMFGNCRNCSLLSGGQVLELIYMTPTIDPWIPCSERFPDYNETSEYLITDKEGRLRHCLLDPYMPETFVTVEERMIVDAVAWRPAPEPYEEVPND